MATDDGSPGHLQEVLVQGRFQHPKGVLSKDDATVLVDGIRSSFEKAWTHYANGCRQLVDAYQGSAWEALGLKDWGEFVTHTLDVDHLKIPKTEREAIVRVLRDGGLSVREIAAATGLGVGTVHRSLTPATVPNGTLPPGQPTPPPEPVTFEAAMDYFVKLGNWTLDTIDDFEARHGTESALEVLATLAEVGHVAQNLAAGRKIRAERLAGRMLAAGLDKEPVVAELHVHPALEIVPEFTGPGFEAFVENVRTYGLLKPIVLTPDGEVLDGRARLRACAMTGVPPRFDLYTGDDPIDYVMAVNVIRSHYTEDQVAARLVEIGVAP